MERRKIYVGESVNEVELNLLTEIKNNGIETNRILKELVDFIHIIDELEKGNDPNYENELKKDGFSPFQG